MKTKKVLSLLLALVMLLSMAACGGNKNPQVNNGGGDGPAGTLNIVAADFGYGINWLKAIAQVYMAQNKNATIKIEGTVIPHQIISQIEGGLAKYDMIFSTSELYLSKDFFVNLDDVYASIPNGEEKTIAEKVGTLNSAFQYKGEYYSMPSVMSPTSMVVNDTTMKEIYGDNYTLPNTTDEMMKLFDELKTKGVYPFIDTPSASYTSALVSTWWAQYDTTGYDNYFLGQYVDENGETQKAMNGESLNQPGKLKALELAAEILNRKNGYNHQYADAMDFAEAQLVFCGHGYGNLDTKKVAFMPNGSWLENEMETTLAEYPVEMRMFRTPVFSAIIETVPDKSIADDAELSALITAIDAGSTALSGTGYEVTQNDFDKVKTARSYVNHVSDGHQVGIVKTCESVELAKDFLRFLASDAASSLAMKELGGLTLAYGFMPSEDKTAEVSSFIQSVYDLCEGAVFMNHHGTDKINGVHITRNPNGYIGTLISGTSTAEDVYNEDVTKYTAEWQYLLSATE